GEREIDAETPDRLLQHALDRAVRHSDTRILVLRGRIDDGGPAVEDELARPVVPGYLGEELVRPAQGDLQRVEDVQRLAVGTRVDPDRPRLKRELLGTQALAHAQQCRTRLFADRRLRLLC